MVTLEPRVRRAYLASVALMALPLGFGLLYADAHHYDGFYLLLALAGSFGAWGADALGRRRAALRPAAAAALSAAGGVVVGGAAVWLLRGPGALSSAPTAIAVVAFSLSSAASCAVYAWVREAARTDAHDV